MKRAFLVLILLLLPLVSAQEINNFHDYSTVEASFELEGGFELTKGNKAIVESATSQLSFIPRTNQQQTVKSYQTEATPQAEIEQEESQVNFVWKKPKENDFTFKINSAVEVRNALITVEKKIPFPLTTKDSQYIQESEFIDISPEIKAKAQELAQGEDDLYQVAFNVANWTQQSINYSLETLTAEVVQKSSWVYENRFGVCDELTNLFIAMMRSLNVPTKFVSGMAYTNLDYKWGPHAWAEVYFPEKGWIPFDVTYGQFGWVDPGHIKLKESIDSNDPSVKYEWKSFDTSFQGKELILDSNLIKLGEKIQSPSNLHITPLKDKLSEGSFLPLEVTIENTQNHYLPQTITITKAHELTESNTKRILLKPKETKTLYWIAELPSETERGFTYTLTLEAKDNFNKKTETTVNFGKGFEELTREEAEQIIQERQPLQETKTTTKIKQKTTTTKEGPKEGLQLELLNKPSSLNYKEDFELKLFLTTEKTIENIQITINEKTINGIPKLEHAREIIINSQGKDFFSKQEINIEISYQEQGEQKQLQETIDLEITNAPWYTKLLKALKLL